MRRAAILAASLAALAWPSAGPAAPPLVTATASPTTGPAPLTVTLTAAGDEATYDWDFGDGETATGASVEHTFASGLHVARVTATSPGGETAQARVRVVAYALSLRAPRAASYRTGALFTGRIAPALSGIPVTITAAGRPVAAVRTRAGLFHARIRIRTPGPYRARAHGALSPARLVTVRSTILASLAGPTVVGSTLRLQARVQPRAAGRLRVRIWRDGRRTFDRVYSGGAAVRMGTSSPAAYVVRLSLVPSRGYTARGGRLAARVYQPDLSVGSRGPSVLALEQRLAELHYALLAVDSSFGYDTRDAVYAFQKIYGLPRTGSVDAAFWRVLQRASIPSARYSGDHVEVDKARQVLFVVRGGKVGLVTHISTGATGNTPLGLWHVYSKIPGWLASGMFDSSFFLRGFAVHGYPSVPPWPASHGCVRVPVWFAARLYGLIPWGSAIVVYA